MGLFDRFRSGDNPQRWEFQTGAPVHSSPTVAEGTVFVGSWDDSAYALDAGDGSELWEFQTGAPVHSSPTVAAGTVFIGSFDNRVYALDAEDGSQRWEFETGGDVDSSPTVADGTVFVGSVDDSVYALDAEDGSQRWEFQTGDSVDSSPTVADGTVFVGSWDNRVYALDAGDGSQRWEFETGGDVDSSPTVAGGTAFVGSWDNRVYALDAGDGSQLWAFETGDYVESSPTVADGTVFVGSRDNSVYALDAEDGSQLWAFETGDNVDSSPTVADGTVFVGSRDNSVYALDAEDGSQRWEFQTGGSVRSSPTVADGTVFVGSGVGDGNVYALDAGVSGSSEGSRVLLWTLGHHREISDSVSVFRPASFDIEITDMRKTMTVDGDLSVAVSVSNTGDQTDTQSIEFAVDGIESTVWQCTLDGGETTTETLTLNSASIGAEEPAVTVSTEDTSDSMVVRPDTFEIVDTNASVEPGQDLTVAAEIANTGNLTRTKSVEINIGESETTTREVSLSAGESETIDYSTTAHELGAGEYTVTVSTEDDSASDSLGIHPATFEIVGANVSVEPGQDTTVTAEIVNTGDVTGTESVEINIGESETITREVTLSAGESKPIDYSTTAHELGAGEYTVTVSTEDDSASDSLGIRPVTFEIVSFETQDTVEPGESLTLSIEIINTGTLSGAKPLEIDIEGLETATRELDMDSGESETLTLSVPTEALGGNHSVTVSTEDDTERTAVTVLTPARFEIERLETDEPSGEGGFLDIEAEVVNTGIKSAQQSVSLEVEGLDPKTREFDLDGDESDTLSRSVLAAALSEHRPTVTVSTNDDAATTTVTVGESPTGVAGRTGTELNANAQATAIRQNTPSDIPDAAQATLTYDDIEKGELLGRGGNANVFNATAEVEGNSMNLAVKEPQIGGGNTVDIPVVERMIDEAETWQQLDDHDYIAGVVDYGAEPLSWIAIEHMDGGHLGERVEELGVAQKLWTAIAITEGVNYAHRRGVAHLDLKPENILFRSVEGAWDVPKVADWGLSKHLLEHSQSIEGLSPQYAAPEQFDDSYGAADDVTDIYQLGAVFYKLFTGQPPFEGQPAMVMNSVLNEQPDPPSAVADVPPEIDDVLQPTLAKEKDERYESVLYLRDNLQEIRG